MTVALRLDVAAAPLSTQKKQETFNVIHLQISQINTSSSQSLFFGTPTAAVTWWAFCRVAPRATSLSITVSMKPPWMNRLLGPRCDA